MKKVVSATLAGALAVGMVPAMALADDSVELLAEDTDVVEQGKISAFAGGAQPATEFVVGDAEGIQAIVPIAVVEGGATTGVKHNVYTWQVAKYDPKADANQTQYTVGGKPANVTWPMGFKTMPTEAGTYAIFAAVQVGSETVWVTDGVAFTVVPKGVNGELAFYEIARVGGEVVTADTTHIYKGGQYNFSLSALTDGNLGVSADGVALKPGEDYTISPVVVKDAETNLAVTGDARAAAGEYYVEVNFNGVHKKVFYTIEKFDVAEADIELVSNTLTLAQAKASGFSIKSVNDGDNDAMVEIVKTSEDFKSENLLPGEYTVTVGLKDAYEKDASCVAGSTQDVKVAVVGQVINDLVLTYPLGTTSITAADDDLSPVATDDYTVNRAAADYTAAKEFDVNKLIVTDGSGKVYTNVKPVVSKKNVYGEYVECDPSELTDGSKGDYKVKAVLVDSTYATAGETPEIEVSITNGTIQAADVAFAYNNANVTTKQFDGNGALDYTGKNFLDDFAVSVKVGGKAVAASDYSVVVKKYNALSAKTDKWEVVTDGIVNVGQYKIEVTSTKYDIVKTNDANVLYVDVDPVKVDALLADQIDTQGSKFAEKEFIWTGEAINPIAGFAKVDDQGNFVDKKGQATTDPAEFVMIDVPADAYKVTITKFTPKGAEKPVLTADLPTSFVEPGDYEYTLVDVTDASAKLADDNWDVTEITQPVAKLTITDANVYADVPANAWFADEVLAAAQNRWMMGYAGTNMFGPYDTLTREQLALIMCRVAGIDADTAYLGDASLTIVKVETDFADVDETSRYALAIKKMDEAGILTGYTGSDNYGPKDPVTREMLATVLMRLEKSGLLDEDAINPLASALGAYADADEISGWAVAGVEWAVENGMMGVDTKMLNPTDDVTRAEAAAMLVRYDANVEALY